MKKYIHNLTITKNQKLSDDTFILEVVVPSDVQEILPGQFVEVLVENSTVFLRRPISVHDFDSKTNTLSLFIKIVGEGTSKLSTLKAGNNLNIVYPLGNGFTLTEQRNVLLIGGGCGAAPLLYLARALFLKKNNIHILMGGRTDTDILEIEEFETYGAVFCTTETGCCGEKGFVTDHSFLKSNIPFDRIYSCGPLPMMKAVASFAKIKNIPCEVSLENTMACGIGACLCCVTETTEGNKCVCTEGPVFNIEKLKW